MTPDVLDRFWPKVKPADDGSGCLIWTGCHGGQGYGWLRVDGRAHPAHRLAYEHFIGPIPEGLTIDHLCRNRLCVNWQHLEAVTRGENVLRGIGFAAINKAKTHCPAGHEYTPENTFRDKGTGWRKCRTCGNIRSREARRQRAVTRLAA